jgi:hypothetical protein
MVSAHTYLRRWFSHNTGKLNFLQTGPVDSHVLVPSKGNSGDVQLARLGRASAEEAGLSRGLRAA